MIPAVSVIIPTYNRARYIRDAIASVLMQDFGDFELIVVDDGSTDDSLSILESIGDPRLRIVRHGANYGIPAARNTGLDEARGRFIAWLDSDDIARPHRLRKQVAFLSARPETVMVGGCAGKMTPSGAPKRGTRVPPLCAADVGAWLLFRTAFQMSSVMGRADILKSCRYREEYPVLEDLDVYLRLARSHRLENMADILIDRRIHPGQSIRQYRDAIENGSIALLRGPLEQVGMTFSEDDLRKHILLAKPWLGSEPIDLEFLRWAEDWMDRLQSANGQSRYVDSEGLRLAIGFFWFLSCRAASKSLDSFAAAKIFARTPLRSGLYSAHARAWIGRALPLWIKGQSRRDERLPHREPAGQ